MRHRYLQRFAWTLILIMILGLPLLIGNYYLLLMTLAGIAAVVAVGLNILAGYTGQLSLGHAGLYAVGAYLGALLTTTLGINFWIALPIAALAAAAIGALLALPSLKLEGPYLAMVTIAFGFVVNGILIEWADVTGGTQGILHIPKVSIGGLALSFREYYVLVLAFVVVSIYLVRNLAESAWGKAFLAVKQNEIAAEAVGLSTYRLKTVAFTLSAVFAGVGGVLFAHLQGFISPEAFEFDTSLSFLIAVMLGGLATTIGPVVGAVILTFLPEFLQGMQDYRLIIYGSLIVLFLYFLPLGIVGNLRVKVGRVLRQRKEPVKETVPGSRTDMTPPLMLVSPHQDSSSLEVNDVRMLFGGVAALGGVSLRVEPGTVHALIGPNGAGKTVFLNIVCGFYRPTDGVVRFGGHKIQGLPPHRISRFGIARTFQTAQLFGDLSTVENVMLGQFGHSLGGLLQSFLLTPGLRAKLSKARTEAEGILAFVGYNGPLEDPVQGLPFGHQRLVEIARALASRPSLLVMDEPAAGLNPEEVAELAQLILRIRAAGVTVLLVEHHMDLVMGISDRITVLDYGVKLSEGTPADVRGDPKVIEAYLGFEVIANAS